MINAFWGFTANRDQLDDSERLLQITEGFSAHLFRALQVTFDLQDRDVESLLNNVTVVVVVNMGFGRIILGYRESSRG